MELLIEASLWQPQWAALLPHWQQQGHRWQLLLGKEAAAVLDQTDAPWASSPPDGVLCPGALLAAWLDGDLLADFHVDPSRQILISASTSLLTLAREQGLLTLGPVGPICRSPPRPILGAVLNRLLARRMTVPTLAEGHSLSGVVLRPLQADDEREIVRYCSDEALARYTLNIPHPLSAGGGPRLAGAQLAQGGAWPWLELGHHLARGARCGVAWGDLPAMEWRARLVGGRALAKSRSGDPGRWFGQGVRL